MLIDVPLVSTFSENIEFKKFGRVCLGRLDAGKGMEGGALMTE